MARPGAAAVVLFFCALFCVESARAHDFHPGVLALRETTPGHFSVRWSPPEAPDGQGAPPSLHFPAHCKKETGWQLNCAPRGLLGPVEVRSVSGEAFRVTFLVTWNDGSQTTRVLQQNAPVEMYGAARGAGAAVWSKLSADYVALGFEHILLGLDHLLFVLGLILVVGFRAPLVVTVTAFTIAHSLALLASTSFMWSIPARSVEVAIALSVLLVAVEATEREETWTRRLPWAVALVFGLIHGLGFAGAIQSVGLPPHHATLALFCFNVGVELGQLLVIAILGTCAWGLARQPLLLPGARGICIYGMGSCAVYLCLQRFGELL